MVGVAGSSCADEEGDAKTVVSLRSVAASRTESAEREPVERSAPPTDVVVAELAEEVGNASVWDRVVTAAECPNECAPPALARGVVTVAVLL